MTTEKQKRKLIERLRNKYRLVVMNDDTFEERFSLRLTPLGFLILIFVSTSIMIALVVSLVAFTPLREYIPGYADVGMQKDLMKLTWKTDSMEKALVNKQKYMDNLSMILSGRDSAELPSDPRDTTKKYTNLDFRPSAADSALRNEIESMDQYSLAIGVKQKGGISGFFFFIPVTGSVTNTFNASEEHFGVDVTASDENEPVRVTLDGTVISAGWTTGDGYVISVQHSDNLISIYKHNAALLKKPGEYVKAGDPIAIVGSSGEQISGPHIHFELWYNGTPIDPNEYMVFQ
ncbi:MAG: M23 family metallopeptidase [Bacteroidota bacterium]|nr:M23 family metallopeptidase [Bacteroidota bacterium]